MDYYANSTHQYRPNDHIDHSNYNIDINALCPFFLYRMDIYDQIKIQHPNLRITQITRIIGEMWKSVDPKLKQRYQQQYELNRKTASAERQRYQRQYGRQVKSRRSKKLKRAMVSIRRHFDKDF